MSADTPHSRIDWNGEGNAPTTGRILKPRNLMRKAAAPAAIGLVGLALVGALAVGPFTRSLTTPDAGTEVASVQVASATTEADSAQPAAVAEPVAAVAPGASTAARMTGQQASAGLAANDPRWSADALAVDESNLAELKKAVDETVAAVEIASAMGSDGTDVLFTSTIPAQAAGFAPERPVTSSRERSAFDAALSGASAEVAAEPAVASGLETAKATQYVNMRSAPADDASVVTVVPANATIEAETDCRWCEVSYDGQKGYIFQSFITR